MRTGAAVIVDALRTPVGRQGGALAQRRSDELAALLLAELVRRNGLDPAQIDDVVLGCVTQTGEQGFNIARNAVLAAGFPVSVPGTSVNRLCASGLQALANVVQAVESGAMDLVLAGGTESMTRVPMGSDAGPWAPGITSRHEVVHQGEAAERIAEKWGLSRRDLDEYAYGSHRKALAADVAREILPVDGVAADQGPRKDTSIEKMGTLKPAFRPDGRVTAGNSSQISDGAAMLLVASEARAKALGLKPRARVIATSVVGVDPTLMLTGPIPATEKVLRAAGLRKDEVDLYECNEAFASVALAWLRETGIDAARVNVNGGAIALGHPLGASGARLAVTLLHELERRGLKRGLVTLCIGMGQGMAMVLERT